MSPKRVSNNSVALTKLPDNTPIWFELLLKFWLLVADDSATVLSSPITSLCCAITESICVCVRFTASVIEVSIWSCCASHLPNCVCNCSRYSESRLVASSCWLLINEPNVSSSAFWRCSELCIKLCKLVSRPLVNACCCAVVFSFWLESSLTNPRFDSPIAVCTSAIESESLLSVCD